MPFLPNFARDARGNVALTFSIVLIFLCLSVGVAIDYAVVVDRKRSTDQAVDQAALAATVAAMKAREEGRADWAERGREIATKIFNANLPSKTNYQIKSFEPELTFANNTVSATARYRAQSSTSFMQIFQKDFIPFDGEAQAVSVAPAYIDLHFLIDGSASMGIGADTPDQIKMVNSPTACAFACHQDTSRNPKAAHDVGAILRIDVIRNSIKTVITKLIAKKPRSGTVRVAFHIFSKEFTTLLPLTSDLSAVLTKADEVDMVNGVGGASYVTYALKKLAADLGTAGDGTSNATRSSFVIFLSDGIEDSANVDFSKAFFNKTRDTSKWTDTAALKLMGDKTYMQPFTAVGCATMKSKGHRVLAAQIKYVEPYGLEPLANDTKDVKDSKAFSREKVKFVQNELAAPIVNAFKACATTPATDYVIAKNSAEIGPMLSQILDGVILPQIARLAQ